MENKDLNKKILESTEHFEVPANKSESEIWLSISGKIKDQAKVRSLKPLIFQMAASVSILLIAGFFALKSIGNVEVNSDDSVVGHVLPDGSNVTLNTASAIEYNKYFWALDRSVNLEGVGFFDVEKGSNFRVYSKQGIVSVLGTEFNIVALESNYSVYCFEGKVEVKSTEKNDQVILAEGMATSLSENNLTNPYSFNKEKIAAWKNGMFFFEETNLNEVFSEIEKYYQVKIVIETDTENKKFSGVFKKGKLETVMEIVCSSMGLTYEMGSEEIRVKSL